MRIFQPKLLSTIKDYRGAQPVRDIVAGIIVAIIALPLSIALAIASGVSPEQGLITAIFAGFVIAMLGGSRVNISGPTAAFTTIIAGIVMQYGASGLALATLMAGIILIVMGICRFGSFITYIPHTIVIGFTGGIAVTIVIGQIKDFFGLTFREGASPVETVDKLKEIFLSFKTLNLWAVLVGVVSLAILILWPKLSKKIPASLIAVAVGILLVRFLPIPVNTIGDLYVISGKFPAFSFPRFDFATVKNLLPSAFTIALLAAIESLLSCVVSDGMIGDRHNSNTELIAQGAGNICSCLFGGIPATGAIARTAANIDNGGRTPVSGMVHAITLLLIYLLLMPLAALIPMPTIAAILFMVAYNMCGWRKFVKLVKEAPVGDILVLLVSFILTVVFDIIVAIAFGMVMAAFLFIRRSAESTRVRAWVDADTYKDDAHKNGISLPEGVMVCEVEGTLFFASADKLTVPVSHPIKVLILRMGKVASVDMPVLLSLEVIAENCKRQGVTLILSHVQDKPLQAMKKAGLYTAIGEENFTENIESALNRAIALTNTEVTPSPLSVE